MFPGEWVRDFWIRLKYYRGSGNLELRSEMALKKINVSIKT